MFFLLVHTQSVLDTHANIFHLTHSLFSLQRYIFFMIFAYYGQKLLSLCSNSGIWKRFCILFLFGVNPSPMCLAHLLVTGNMVKTAFFEERGSGLLEVEWHIGLDALFTDVQHPVIVTDTGITSRLATDGDLLTPLSIPVHRGSGGLRACSPEH